MLDRSNLILSASLNSKLPAVFNFLQLSLTWLNQFVLFCNLQLKFKVFEPFLRSENDKPLVSGIQWGEKMGY